MLTARDVLFIMPCLSNVRDKSFGVVTRVQPPYGQQQFNSYTSRASQIVPECSPRHSAHNDNLARWRRSEGLSSNCKLRWERQTLLYVSNHCSRAQRYNEQHDAVLEGIVNFVTEFTRKLPNSNKSPMFSALPHN